MTPAKELEIAAAYVLRAKELAEFYGKSQLFIDRCDLLKRALVKIIHEDKQSCEE